MLSPGRLHTDIVGSDSCLALAFVSLASPKCTLLSITNHKSSDTCSLHRARLSSTVCLYKLSHTSNLETRNYGIKLSHFYCLKFDSSRVVIDSS